MIKGIGLDIVEIDRIYELMNRTDKFQRRILSERELSVFKELSEKRKCEFLAGRFAAKEAFSKANGTGIREGCEFHQIEILNDELGKPILYFNGQAVNGFVSITHSRDYAAAQVIILNS
ncbi:MULTISPECIES: holo-ACP synthase [Ureibacillus]|jgi:holo-[acyl-carrier protein] synthase|uniref:Holo-[acyl-carrier-protein] synthase n=1 Tax=Ureibacillus thermosphaericus TaxID=51173 RepID=A0A840PYX2_URETH|nr:holo-ACP synthase [Ureibacillus thermosphaericus]MBB5149842.1 holo-[acyl-carrier protein] synthase [Ureibacillus thermosphaericus]NKZ32554.1 holo-ACP synthase [Ureibacillus thermosphaericus]